MFENQIKLLQSAQALEEEAKRYETMTASSTHTPLTADPVEINAYNAMDAEVVNILRTAYDAVAARIRQARDQVKDAAKNQL
jgi:hypothetical protein